MTEEEKAEFLRSRGWHESCLYDGYWSPPKGVKLADLSEEQETGKGGWAMAVSMRLVVTTDEALEYEHGFRPPV